MKTLWILTKEFNAYDQYGEYFKAAFDTKPSFQELKAEMDGEHNNVVQFVLDTGGGRQNNQDIWYHLRELTLKGNSYES